MCAASRRERMAIYHCSATVIGRAKGRSIVAAAAYRAGERLDDNRTGLTHDFTRKGGVLHSEIMAPSGSPSWATDRATVWNKAEEAEDASTRRATATTGREFRLALPHELDAEARLESVRAFARHMVTTFGVVVDFSIHAPDHAGDDRNHHAHILISDRRMTDAGFTGKVRELAARTGGKENIRAIRAEWARIANSELERAGINTRIDAGSYKAQWIDREATAHLGPAAAAMERRGEGSDIGDRNRAVRTSNAARESLRESFDKVGAALKNAEVSRERRRTEREEQGAIRTHDPAAILAAITARRSTFTKAELAAAIRKSVFDPPARTRLLNDILSRPEIVALSERPGGKVTRYTTEGVLQHEAEGLAAARDLMADRRHAVGRLTARRIVESGRYGSMSAEQHAAFLRCTGPEALAIIAGEAGTGKSYVAGAIRAAYEMNGGRVVGLAVTNKVIQDMQRDGFAETRTIHGALRDIERGQAGWNRHTILMVDEAAMLSTDQLGRVLAAARDAGAKVIAIQDTAQLGSAFARGGLAGAMEAQHPAAVSRLSEVRRIKATAQDAEGQRRAFNFMHEGRWREALAIFDKAGAIRWSQTTAEARAELAARYAVDVAARPDRRRVALAHSNADVLALNAELRAVHRERGDLGADHALPTKDGPAAFATGDRVQFTVSAYRKADREAGLANGNHGTIREIDGLRVTVELDGAKGKAGRIVAFTVGANSRAGEFDGLRHGYAGTVYRSQGSTLDDVYRLHTGHEGAATNYVGNSRHTEALHVFTSREAVRGTHPWMMEAGGLDGLSEAKRESAERSYSAWTEANPDLGRRHGLADYVSYVQGKWTDEQSRAVDLDQLARQMSRREENRAASQFHRIEGAARTPEGAANAPERAQEATAAATLPRAAAVVTTPRASLLARLAAYFRRSRAATTLPTMREAARTREAEPSPPVATQPAPLPTMREAARKAAAQRPQQPTAEQGQERELEL